MIINIITMLATVIPIIFAAVTYYRDTKRKAQQDTIEAYNLLQKDVLCHISRLTPSEVREFANKNRSEEYKQMTEYLMAIECFCIGIEKRIYDFDIFYALTKDYFNNQRGAIRPTIEPMLEEKLKQTGRNYYPSLERIWKRMDERSNG